MQILAHRGYWDKAAPANSFAALRRSIEAGFGFESDVRDYKGQLVISHNIATEDSLPLDKLLCELEQHPGCCFAINIKADGLGEKLQNELKKHHIANFFAFDMSTPQMVEYADLGISFFTRQSEYEVRPVLYEKAEGVWMDAFTDDSWLNSTSVQMHIKNGKKVCLVSPELHCRPYDKFWKWLKTSGIALDKVLLCTDHPGEAKRFF